MSTTQGWSDSYLAHRFVRDEDLNAARALSGGTLFGWCDDIAAIHATLLVDGRAVLTRAVRDIEFHRSATTGHLLQFESTVQARGRTSLTLASTVTDIRDGTLVARVAKLVFVVVDESGVPSPL